MHYLGLVNDFIKANISEEITDAKLSPTDPELYEKNPSPDSNEKIPFEQPEENTGAIILRKKRKHGGPPKLKSVTQAQPA